MEILKNDCFSVDGRTYRYLVSFPVPPRLYVIDINDATAVPKRWSREYLHELSSPPVKLKRVATVMPSRPHSERARDLALGYKRYVHVMALLAHEGIYDKLTRGQLLREYSAKSGVSTDALLTWLRMWWQRGQMLDALTSNYHRSGRITETTEGALAVNVKEQGGNKVTFIAPARGKPRGANPKPAEGYGVNKSLRGVGVNAGDGNDVLPPRYIPYQIADEERLKILGIAWNHYGENRHKSMRGATTRVLAEMYVEREADGSPRLDKDGNYIVLPQGRRPSYRQIQCILNKAKSLSVAYRARHSPAAYANNIQPRYGSVKEDCLGPGDVYDIDATTLDFNCVDRATKQFIIGRPTLYLVSDRWSRLIVGFHVGLDNPSWAEAKLAVMSISADWRAMASRFRVRVTDRDLVANGRWPNRFFADRGNDMLVGASDRICDGMETQITNARALRAVSKGIVESEFKGTSTALRQIVPGYIPPEDNRQRRGKPHAKNARLTLDTLRANLFRIVITRNRMHLNGYEASSKEIALGHSLAPVDIWQRGVENMTTYGMRFPYDYVRQKLMSRGRAKVQGDGFSFGQCRYFVPELGEWHVRARLLGTFLVDVSYESSLVDNHRHPRPHRLDQDLRRSSDGQGQEVGGLQLRRALRRIPQRNAHQAQQRSSERGRSSCAVPGPAGAEPQGRGGDDQGHRGRQPPRARGDGQEGGASAGGEAAPPRGAQAARRSAAGHVRGHGCVVRRNRGGCAHGPVFRPLDHPGVRWARAGLQHASQGPASRGWVRPAHLGLQQRLRRRSGQPGAHESPARQRR